MHTHANTRAHTHMLHVCMHMYTYRYGRYMCMHSDGIVVSAGIDNADGPVRGRVIVLARSCWLYCCLCQGALFDILIRSRVVLAWCMLSSNACAMMRLWLPALSVYSAGTPQDNECSHVDVSTACTHEVCCERFHCTSSFARSVTMSTLAEVWAGLPGLAQRGASGRLVIGPTNLQRADLDFNWNIVGHAILWVGVRPSVEPLADVVADFFHATRVKGCKPASRHLAASSGC